MNRRFVTRVHDDAREQRYRDDGFWSGLRLHELTDRWVAERGDAVALDDGAITITYRELSVLSRRGGDLFRALGVQAEDVVVAYLSNTALLPVVHLAVNRLGAALLPMPSMWRRAEVSATLATARPRLVIIPDDDESGEHRGIAEASVRDANLDAVLMTTSEFFARVTTSVSEDTHMVDDEIERKDSGSLVCLIMCSSGSTGAPKLSALSNDNLYAHLVTQALPSLGIGGDDRFAAIAPANTGSTGYVYGVLAALIAGAQSHILRSWSASAALDIVERGHCTVATTIPTQLKMMIETHVKGGDRTKSPLRVVITAGAPISPSTAIAAEQEFECRVFSIYGASESGLPTLLNINDPDEKRHTMVGRVAPGQELRIIDANGDAVPHGEPGEITWRGPSNSYGFYNQASQDAVAWADGGWFRSGDIGQVDAEGYLRVVGRLKDMIIRGGHNVFPAEIEKVLHEHSSISEIAIVGVPDERLGERACAVVVSRRQDQAPTITDLTAFLDERGVARYKHPEYLLVVDSLPHASSGKLDKNEIRRMARESVAVSAASSD